MFRLTHWVRDSEALLQRGFGEGAAAAYLRAARQVGLDPLLSDGRRDDCVPVLTLAVDGRSPFEARQMERRIHALVEMEEPRYFGHIVFRWHLAARSGPAAV